MNAPVPRLPRQHPHQGSSGASPRAYITIPARLIAELRDSPLAIGLYSLVARLYFAAHAPVPLSRGDIQRYDPTLKEGAVKRALDRLIAGGWIIEAAGHKSRYTPSWGRARDGAPRPWRIGADYLGCPRHTFTLRLDCGILDVYMGKLTLQAQSTALIDRYVTAPLLSLRDVGAYLLILAGQEHLATPALLRWDLVRDGLALPVPHIAQVLALASQRQLEDDGAIEITDAGWRKLGLSAGQRSPQDHAPTAQPLFFMPPELIGSLIPPSIGALIGHDSQAEMPISAPERGTSDTVSPSPIIQRTHEESKESRDQPPTPSHPTTIDGGVRSRRFKKESCRLPELPETESAHLLRSIGVLPEVIIELANTPIGRVEEAIAHGRARPEVRDLAGWVVKLLRTARDYDWAISQPRPADAHVPQLIDVERYTSGAYGDLFRRGSDTSDLELTDDRRPATDDRLLSPISNLQSPISNLQPAGDLTRQVREQLRSSCDRQHRGVIERLRVEVMGDTTLIRYASLADARIVQDQLLGAIRLAIAELGAPTVIRLASQAAQSAPPYQARRGPGIERWSSALSAPGAVAGSSP
jgi:hypothetical protein